MTTTLDIHLEGRDARLLNLRKGETEYDHCDLSAWLCACAQVLRAVGVEMAVLPNGAQERYEAGSTVENTVAWILHTRWPYQYTQVSDVGLELKRLWVTTYEVSREYGGPEEGGWWWDRRVVAEAVRCGSPRAAEALRQQIQTHLGEQDPRELSSVLGRGVTEVDLEVLPGQYERLWSGGYC